MKEDITDLKEKIESQSRTISEMKVCLRNKDDRLLSLESVFDAIRFVGYFALLIVGILFLVLSCFYVVEKMGVTFVSDPVSRQMVASGGDALAVVLVLVVWTGLGMIMIVKCICKIFE